MEHPYLKSGDGHLRAYNMLINKGYQDSLIQAYMGWNPANVSWSVIARIPTWARRAISISSEGKSEPSDSFVWQCRSINMRRRWPDSANFP